MISLVWLFQLFTEKNKVKYTLKQNLSLKRAICIHEGFKIFSNSYSPKSTATLLPLSLDLKLLQFFLLPLLVHVLHLGKIFTHLFIYKTFYFYIQLIQSRFTKKNCILTARRKFYQVVEGLGVSVFFFHFIFLCVKNFTSGSHCIQSFHSNSRDLI